MKNPYFALLFGLLIFSACKKKEDKPAAFIFYNNEHVAINIDIYRSVDDYWINYGRFLSIRIEPWQSYELPYDHLKKGDSVYCIDAYSDDHTYSNWPFVDPTIVISPSFRSYQLSLKEGVTRVVLLDRDKTKTIWKAIDVRNDIADTSIWDQLSEDEKHLQLTVTKSQHCIIERKQQGSLYQYIKPSLILNYNISGITIHFSETTLIAPSGMVTSLANSTDTLLFSEPYYNSQSNTHRQYVLVRE